jgi:hypothetical protein
MRSHCYTCGLDFRSEYAFDQHRIGPHVPIDRPMQRCCLTPAELQSSGWSDTQGIWRTPSRSAKRGSYATVDYNPTPTGALEVVA